jgi:hypothetical protein
VSIGRVHYGAWVLRIITWDAVLRVCVAFLPLAVKLLFPNRRAAMEVTAVILPIVAFLLRFRAGRRQIGSNRSPRAIQRIQFGVFCLGILPLVLIDSFLILSHLMPPGALWQHPGDRMILVLLFSIYLASMVVAMYPGRERRCAAESDDFPGVDGTRTDNP